MCVCMWSLFNGVLNNWYSRPIASNVWMIIKKELEMVWREAVVACLSKVISLIIAGVTEWNDEKPKKQNGRYFGRN